MAGEIVLCTFIYGIKANRRLPVCYLPDLEFSSRYTISMSYGRQIIVINKGSAIK